MSLDRGAEARIETFAPVETVAFDSGPHVEARQHASGPRRAPRDGVVALPDRRCFRERIAHCAARAHRGAPLGVVRIDLEILDAPSSALGGLADGELMRMVVARLLRSVRAEDVVARFGTTEFACLLTDADGRASLAGVARRLCAALAMPFRVGSGELRVRACLGVAICPHDGATPEVLLKHADDARWRARETAAGFALFDRVVDS